MTSWLRKSLSGLALILLCSGLTPAAAEIPDSVNARLDAVFETGREAFFETVNLLLDKHFLRDDLTPGDLERIRDGGQGIPTLFERIINLAYQKDAPLYEGLIAKGDDASLDLFEKRFNGMARDYAARFVGSLFRTGFLSDLSWRMPRMKDKSRLDVVLQTLGYGVNHTVPDIPEEERYRNQIEEDISTQWAIEAVNARKGWTESKGGGVVVAMLDSGIDPFNSFFKGRMVKGASFLRRSTPPWSGEDPPNIDYGLHGSGVSTALLAIAPECRVMMIRTGDSDTMNDPPLPYWHMELHAAGIYRAVHSGAHIISISSSLHATEPVVMEAVRYAYEKNVAICSSAGNIPRAFLGIDPKHVVYHAFDQEVLLIGGVHQTERGIRPWPASIPNMYIDVAAPSVDVFVLVPTYLKDQENQYAAGTSLSAPIAAGVVAVMRAAAPPTPELLAEPGEYVRLITQALRGSARLNELGMTEPNQAVGYGLIDAAGAIQRLRELMER